MRTNIFTQIKSPTHQCYQISEKALIILIEMWLIIWKASFDYHNNK